tara:strand:- start:10028 stop:11566 length:1539 start_codon:yes stop_codon:yes gene_type:complete
LISKNYRRRIPQSKNQLKCLNQQSIFNEENFKYLNKNKIFKDKIEWGARDDLLWHYNLNYFDDLNSVNAEQRIDLHYRVIISWIRDNPPGEGIPWQPYPSSLRIVNWIKWVLIRSIKDRRIDESILFQSRWLSKNIEYHIDANHLLANIKALIFSSFYFEGVESNNLLKKYEKSLLKLLSVQINEDGGHFERSPMYHRIVLVDLLEIISVYKLYGREIPSQIMVCAEKMLTFMINFNHIDNDVSFFNDSTFGVSTDYNQIIEYAKMHDINHRFTPGSLLFSSSGFARLSNKKINLLMDVGSLKPKFQPGHSHASTLSIECSISGHRFFVNSGISTYENSDLRIYQRGTSSHNTITLNNKNSSDVWSSFRVGRKAEAKINYFSERKNSIEASHNGYNKIKSIDNVKRSVAIFDEMISINDTVDSSGSYKAIGRWFISPNITLIEADNESMRYLFEVVENGKIKQIKLTIMGAHCSEINKSNYFTGFNREEQNYCISYKFSNLTDSVKTRVEIM